MPRLKKHRVRVNLTMSVLSNKRLRALAKDRNCELSAIADAAINSYFFTTQIGKKLLAKIVARPENLLPDPVDLPPLI
jgi:hypothetical protein